MATTNNEALCPTCGVAIGDHTIRGYAECTAGLNFVLPYESVPGGMMEWPGVENSIMAGSIVARALVADTPLGKVPVLGITFTGPSATPGQQLDSPTYMLALDDNTMLTVGKLLDDSARGAVKAARKAR